MLNKVVLLNLNVNGAFMHIYSTISSVLNAAAGQVWDDMVKPYTNMSDSKATIVTKCIGRNSFFFLNYQMINY